MFSGNQGFSTSRGFVEVLFGAVWGTVCRDTWDLNDSHVVCRHLGYDGAQNDSDPELFYDFHDIQPKLTWMNNVLCNGNESFLSECGFNGWDRAFCQFFPPASVICNPPGISLFFFFGIILTLTICCC